MMNKSVLRIVRSGHRALAVALTLGLASASLMALDLPTKKIKNRNYYYYKVEKGETVYSLTHRFGISHADMVKYNPSVADGLKTGQTLYFPVDEFGTEYGGSTTTTEHIVRKGDTLFSLAGRYGVSSEAIVALNPGADQGIKIGQKLIIPGGTAMAADSEPATTIPMTPELPSELTPVDAPVDVTTPPAGVYASEGPELSVAVCLPFMLGDNNASKTAVYATDFYRGFLLAVDSLRPAYGNPPVRILAIDSDAPDQPFNALTKNAAELRKCDIIIAPETVDRIEELGDFGRKNNVYVFNTFQTRDTTCMTNPYMLQGNALQSDMYDKVIDYFIAGLNGATPVILDNEKGSKDKQAFVDALSARLIDKGIDYKTIKYNGTMTSGALLEKLPPEDVNYVFVPMSGSLTEFHKFATALTRYKTEAAEAVTPGRARLFGYPEYTRFSGDALDKLKALNTTFYSRFYNDPTSTASANITASFIDRYGTSLPDGVPNQALYGFDVAHWLLSLASQGQVSAGTIVESDVDDGAQMAYRFRRIDNGGFVNDAIIIVTLDENLPTHTEVI